MLAPALIARLQAAGVRYIGTTWNACFNCWEHRLVGSFGRNREPYELQKFDEGVMALLVALEGKG